MPFSADDDALLAAWVGRSTQKSGNKIYQELEAAVSYILYNPPFETPQGLLTKPFLCSTLIIPGIHGETGG